MVDEVLPEAYSRIRSQLLEHANVGSVVDMQSIFLDLTSFVMGHMAYDVCSSAKLRGQLLMHADGPRFVSPLQ